MSTQLVVTEEPPIRTVADVLQEDEFKQKIAEALPQGVSLDRFVRTTLMAVQLNPDLMKHDQQSLYLAVIQCAKDGLLPDSREAALVLFNDRKSGTKKVRYMPMVGGFRKIAAEHGIALSAYVVYANDTFEYALGFEPTVKHEPPLPLGSDRGEPLGAYAVAVDGLQRYLEPMSVAEIEKVRAVSRAKDDGPWRDWWSEMARKTVVRRLFKQLALASTDERAARMVAASDAEFDLGPSPVDRALTAGPPVDEETPDDNA